MIERGYKFLAAGGVGPFSGFRWPAPAGARPGPWVAADAVTGEGGRVQVSGVHVCQVAALPCWVNDELWLAEVADVVRRHAGTLVAGRGRLVRKIEAWDEPAKAAFSATCAWRARDHAVQALHAAGFDREARALAGCRELEAVAEAAGAVPDGHPLAFACGYAADAAASARAGSPVVAAYVAAHAAQRLPGTPDPGAAYRRERAWQAAWLAERLGLEAEPQLQAEPATG